MNKKGFITDELDLAAAIIAGTDRQPIVLRLPGRSLCCFEFPDDQATRDVVMLYVAGELAQDVKRFASCRAWLYRQARGER